MHEDMYKGLENFDGVWARVTGSSPETCPARDERETLRDFIGDETRDAAFYTALAKKSRWASRTLESMSADERRHARSLQIEYYLMTGESFIPPPSCPLVESVPEALRSAHKGELSGAEAYAAAADVTASPSLRELYLSNAADERRHAEMVKCLISRLI